MLQATDVRRHGGRTSLVQRPSLGRSDQDLPRGEGRSGRSLFAGHWRSRSRCSEQFAGVALRARVGVLSCSSSHDRQRATAGGVPPQEMDDTRCRDRATSWSPWRAVDSAHLPKCEVSDRRLRVKKGGDPHPVDGVPGGISSTQGSAGGCSTEVLGPRGFGRTQWTTLDRPLCRRASPVDSPVPWSSTQAHPWGSRHNA